MDMLSIASCWINTIIYDQSLFIAVGQKQNVIESYL